MRLQGVLEVTLGYLVAGMLARFHGVLLVEELRLEQLNCVERGGIHGVIYDSRLRPRHVEHLGLLVRRVFWVILANVVAQVQILVLNQRSWIGWLSKIVLIALNGLANLNSLHLDVGSGLLIKVDFPSRHCG